MDRIRTGIVGLGRMGQHHCRNLASLRESELIGVYDSNSATARQFSQRYDVPAFQRVEDLLDQVEAVCIATPTPTHFDLVSCCLEKKIHVLVEKPVTETLAQGEALARAVEASGLVVQVGHIERFNPTYVEMKKVMEGLNIFAIHFRRLSPYAGSNKDVDVVLDLMVHDLDLSLDLMGREPDRFSAFGLMPFSVGLDHVVAQLFYQAGPLITLSSSRVTEHKIRCVEVTAQDAFLEADFLNKSISVHRCSSGEYSSHNRSEVKYRQESFIERILVPNIEPLAAEIKHFLECVSDKRVPSVAIADGVRALRMALAVRDRALT